MDVLGSLKQRKNEFYHDYILKLANSSISMDTPTLSTLLSSINSIDKLFLFLIFSLQTMYVSFNDFLKEINKMEDESYATTLKLIRETSQYKELLYEYDIFVSDIAKYLKSINLKSSKDVILYIDNMLKSGYFSLDKFYTYYKYKYVYYELIELLGCKITTGTGMCRHNVCFINDILNKYGIESCILPILDIYNNFNNLKSAYSNPVPNHVILEIIDENGNYCYDPTYDSFVSTVSNDFKILRLIKYNHRLFLYKDGFNSAFNSDEKCDIIKSFSFNEINESEVYDLEQSIKRLFNLNLKYNDEFYNDELEKIKKIANLSMKIMPNSDKKIKSWVIR